MIPEPLLKICNYSGQGYAPLVDYADWRVAMLRYIDELHPTRINRMQKHTDTDEVFVLLEGRCILFLGEGENQIRRVYAQELEPLKLYNVKRNAWHTHTLSEDASVLIVENRDTNSLNSPEIELNPEQKATITSLSGNIWKENEPN